MTPVGLPPGLADMPPGPLLSAALAGVELPRLANSDTVTVLAARYRQLAHEQARLLEALVEVGRSDPDDLSGVRRLGTVGGWAGGEIAAALTLTGVAADRELAFADTVVTHLPAVHTALSAGTIDRAKAWMFADHLTDLPAEQTTIICIALVPVAPGLTTGQLRARLARMLHDIDPEHARRRYQRAVRERAVIGYLAPDGSVTITANGLPADEAAVACERLDVLARTIQRAGHPARLGQLQTDLFLGMLDGSLHGMSEPEIIAAMFDRPRPEDAEPGDTEPGGPSLAAAAPTTPDTGSPAAAPTRADRAANARTRSDHTEPTPATEPAPPADSSTAAPDDAPPDDAPPDDAAAGSEAASPAPTAPRTGVEIRVGLTTLLGLDQRCGEIPGLGPVLPDTARTLVTAQQHGAQWRYAIVDVDGQLLLAGTTRRRPATPSTDRGRSRGGIVELHIDAHTLQQLATDPGDSPWTAVIADLATQFADRAHRIPFVEHRPGDRFARAMLARHIEIRDRTCCFPGCRRPARKSDKDHTHEHAAGGPTTSTNIGPLCGRHHRYKSLGWWALAQTAPGRFRWTSPLSRGYRTRGEPIRPPTVAPRPRSDTSRSTGSARYRSGPILRRTPEPSRRTEPASPADEPPPF